MLKVYYLKIARFQNLSSDDLLSSVGENTASEVKAYRSERVRYTKLLGESMVRRVLYDLWGLRKMDYRIWRGEHGKPFVKSASPVWFNLSHSGDYIVAAFSDSEVGVDIERISKARMEVARRFFHPAEISALESVSGQEQENLFFRYWSVKESFLKYTGSGLSSPLSGFEVRFGEKQALIWKEGKHLPLQINECPVDAGYKCFVCAETLEDPDILEFTAF